LISSQLSYFLLSTTTFKMASVYVGNMPYQSTENDLGNFFSQVGHVTKVRIVYDRETNRPKGFAFVEFADEQTAQAAINQFNGADFNGRSLRVNMANNRQ
ncbi:hypothetical protein PMAYCL1PPCAC_14891, partial [Pristionchus mayeri]